MATRRDHWLALALRRLAALATMAALSAPCAHAADSAALVSPWRFAGYGTLSYNWDDRDNLAPIRDISQRPANGYATGPGWRMDTRVGLQAAYRLDPQNEFVAQAVVRDQLVSNLDSAVELGYFETLPAPDLKLRLGRFGYDVLLMSDHRNLGYSYAWVRPPRELYGWVPIFSLDGLDLTHDRQAENGLWRVKAQVGRGRMSVPMGNSTYEFTTDSVWSLSASQQSGPWRVKAGVSEMRVGSEAAPLAQLHGGLDQLAGAGLPGISAEAAGLRKELSFQGASLDYLSVGAAYDDGTWLGQAELAYSKSSATILSQGYMGYLAVGRRFGAFTPYLMVSASQPRSPMLAPGSDWRAIGQAGFQNTAYSIANSTRIDQQTATLGVRWDFDDRAALKLQWDRTHIDPFGYTLWFRSLDSEPRSTSVNLLTLSLDFIF